MKARASVSYLNCSSRFSASQHQSTSTDCYKKSHRTWQIARNFRACSPHAIKLSLDSLHLCFRFPDWKQKITFTIAITTTSEWCSEACPAFVQCFWLHVYGVHQCSMVPWNTETATSPLLSVIFFSIMYRKFSFLNTLTWKQLLFGLSKGKLWEVLNLMWRNFIRVRMLLQWGRVHTEAHHTSAHPTSIKQKSSIFKLQCLP